MKLIDKKKVRANTKYLFTFILVLVILIVLENLLNKSDSPSNSLKDKDVNYDKLVINEIMTSNDGVYIDDNGNIYDWIEIYNGTKSEIDLTNYGLSDENSGETKWLFPKVSIKSKEHMIVFLSGKTEKGLVANFALSRKGGETITLKNSNGKVIDSVKTVSLEKANVMARDSDGKWIETTEITPGYSNNKEGREQFLNSFNSESEDLVITEILANNEGNIDFDGAFYDYIEVENVSNNTINLKEYYLSNNKNKPFLWRLPEVELKSGDVYLIYASDLNKDNHASFNLNGKNGIVVLAHKNKVIDSVEYKDLQNGLAYIKQEGKFIESISISPGYPNTTEGVGEFNEVKRQNKKDLIINEVMNQNNEYLVQNGGEYYDWIELYNNSDKTINLSDYTITNDSSFKNKYVLPNVKLKPNSYYIIMASGDTSYSNDSYKHTNFKVSDKESIYIYKDNKLVDSLILAEVPNGYSFGRGDSSGLYYYSNPTPKKANSNNGILEISYAPKFNTEPGVYDDKNSVALKLDGIGTIYYTLDGSEPNQNSKVYNSPIILKETTVVRAVSYEKNKKASKIITGSYIIGEKHTMPVLSLSLPKSSFNLISNNPDSTELTVKAHAELFEDGKSFSIDCGMKLFGGQTRFIAKKSFALKFSSKYGPSKLEYKVFDNRDAVRYDTLVVRSGSQDSTGSMFRDELATSIMNDYGTVDVQAYKPVILYINGNYWGIYFLREKVDSTFVSHHYNVSGEGTNIVRIDYDVSEGTSNSYYSLVNYVATHDMSSDKSYEYVEERLDIDNFIDYWIGALYTTNNDIVNTRYFNNPNVDNGKFKMIFYDFDYAFYNYNIDYMSWMASPNGLGKMQYNNTLLRGLLKNKQFRKRFLERVSYNMKNVWSDENVLNRYNELYKLLEPEMKRNQSRWNSTYSDWQNDCEQLKKYIKQRRRYMLDSIKDYFNLSNEEMKKYFE